MKITLLEKISSPVHIKNMSIEQLQRLAGEIRAKEIESVSKNGGHLASNLGVVELTIALHKVFDSPKDQIVFDVGHQCYAHKLLTGRYNKFDTLRTKDGISGFTRPSESIHDIFYSGHSGTSVSAGLGLAEAKRMDNDKHYVISVIGDGSFTGGMVYEALNNGGRTNCKHIIILNDNKMSISENVGSFAKYLAIMRSTPSYYSFKIHTEKSLNTIPAIGKRISEAAHELKTNIKNRIYPESTFFEDLGYRYIGPVDGHNFNQIIAALQAAKKVNGPVVLHVITTKGKGYEYAEKSPSIFHGISEFDVDTGETIKSSENFSSKFGDILLDRASINKNICAITAAMSLGTGIESFRKKYPDRFFDVGIAEEHAVTFASGLAKNGKIPVFAVYSTFLQRCYDQLIHDVSLQNLKVILAIDRAGFVGDDGETHNGLFDVSFLNSIPRIKVYSPCDFEYLEQDLDEAINKDNCPVAIRYPRGGCNKNCEKLSKNKLEFSIYGNCKSDNLIVTYGRITGQAVEAVDELTDACLLSLNQIKPIPGEAIELSLNYKNIFFFEESELNGGVGQVFATELMKNKYKGNYILKAVDNEFAAPAKSDQLFVDYGLDKNSMIELIKENIYGK